MVKDILCPFTIQVRLVGISQMYGSSYFYASVLLIYSVPADK